MLELTPRPCGPGQDLSTLVAQTERFFKAGKSIATTEAYDADLRAFLSFCTEHGLPYLPSTVETIALYVSSLAAAGLLDDQASAGFDHVCPSPAGP